MPVVFLFGFFIDLIMRNMKWLTPENYIWQLIICLFGCVVLALGVFFEVKAKLTYLPGEGVAMAINKTFNVEFGKAKIGVDSSFVLIGVLCSFYFFRRLCGLREGTIIAALLVGYIVKFLNDRILFLDNWLNRSIEVGEKSNQKDFLSGSIKDKFIITISREYGSGGHEIGEELAKQLGISFYDKELIAMSAVKSGFTEEYINQHEQKLSHSLWYHLYEQNYAYINEKKPPLNALFMVQSQVIRDVSERESCVIIGRCANYVLKNKKETFNVFIHADMNYRAKRISDSEKISIIEAEKEIGKIDRERAQYCKEFTRKDWGDLREYHLIIDTSVFGVAQSVHLIIDGIKKFLKAV